MTNKEEEGETGCEPRLAALLAVHLVSQVLDEAYVIANTASDSGQPWRYLDMLKNLRSGQLKDVEGDATLCEPKVDGDDAIASMENAAANVVATSTPQKACIDCTIKNINDNSFIGQGDEDTDMRQNELTKSTSMFLNHLFDMSEVERIIICDDTEPMQGDSNDLLTEAMTKIMESYVNTALGQEVPIVESRTGERSPSTESSGYSFLADAYTTEIVNDEAFCVEIEGTDNTEGNDNVEVGGKTEVNDKIELDVEELKDDTIKKDDVAFYENTYLTLNRDYDQCSDEDGDPILQDTKGMSLQEVELITMHTSDENSSPEDEPLQPKIKELTATSTVSASANGSRKSGLVQRCRIQGARLLACLRGWWRRKTPGKRKEGRVPGSVRGLCPFSPDARRRAASLLDQRKLCSSPVAPQHVVWKFNTVSEALVNSSRWKNYTFDITPDECGEL